MKITVKSAAVIFNAGSIFLSIVLVLIFMCGCGDDGFKNAINNETGDSPPVPGNSGIVAASYITPTSLDVQWQGAIDDLTPSSDLRYRVFVSMSSFSSIEEAERSGVELTAGWTLGISSLREEIPSAVMYSWCNVFVGDENDQVASYRGAAPLPYANTPPDTDGNSLMLTSPAPLRAMMVWTKATDAQTPQTSLRYRVFRGRSPSDVNTFAHAEADGTEVTSGWTSDIGTIQADLEEGGTWWFNVFVIDGGGLVSGYVQKNITIEDRNPPAVANPDLSLSARSSSVLVSWTKAVDADGGTPRDLLQYRLFCSTTRSVLESSLPPSSNSACDLTKGWITFDPSNADTLSFSANGLLSGMLYYFRVYVRDLDQMTSPYRIAQCTTIAAAYPVPGAAGLITAVPKAAKKIDLAWTAATDDSTVQQELYYSVYSSEITPTNDAYGDIADYAAASAAVRNGSVTVKLETLGNTVSDSGWVRNIIAFEAKMDKSTSYYFNVFVRDMNGNVSAYVPVRQTTN